MTPEDIAALLTKRRYVIAEWVEYDEDGNRLDDPELRQVDETLEEIIAKPSQREGDGMTTPKCTYHRGNEWQPGPDETIIDRDWITFDGTGITDSGWSAEWGASVNRAADIPDEGFGSGPAISVDLWDGDGEHIVCVDVDPAKPEPDRNIVSDRWAEWVAQHVAEYLPKDAA